MTVSTIEIGSLPSFNGRSHKRYGKSVNPYTELVFKNVPFRDI